MCVAPWALASGDAKLMKQVPDPYDKNLWTPRNHYTRALYDFEPGKPCPLPGFADDQEYQYYHGIARAGGQLPRPLAFKLIYDAYTHPMLFRYYCDDWEVPPGINVFDLFPYRMIDGRPTDYRSERKGPRGTVKPIGSRFGPQNMVVCGWALQALKEYPRLWAQRYEMGFTEDQWAHVVDVPGRDDTGGSHPWITTRDVRWKVIGWRDHLEVVGYATGDQLAIRVFRFPDGKGSYASMTFRRSGQVTLANDLGERLEGGPGGVDDLGREWQFAAFVPYTFVKGQKRWANAVEQGRFSIEVQGVMKNIYLLTPAPFLADWLERELGGGLRTWEAIFNEKGYIPTSIGSTYDWDKYSDTGAYAHLLSAAAQWLLCLEGKNDWEMHNIPSVPAAK
jgi:hypothetical protein